jgi:S1-C subfamily serine protease
MKFCQLIASAIILAATSPIATAQHENAPATRSAAESRIDHFKRYKIDQPKFQAETKWVLGVNVDYTTDGARITKVFPGSAADNAGLLVNDIIMEVNEAPVGLIRNRFYEVWRPYYRDNDGKVQLTIAVVKNGQFVYFFPEVQLAPAAAGAPIPSF